jgi:hypothetical protein
MPNGCLYALLGAVGLEATALVCLGLLSLIASGAKGAPAESRLGLAAVCLALGGIQLAAVVWGFWRKMQTRPSAIETRVIALAEATRAPVTVADVSAAVAVPPDDAKAVLDGMVAKRLCEQVGPDRYAVRGIGGQKLQRSCPYCGASLPVRETREVCPQCGAALRLEREDS